MNGKLTIINSKGEPLAFDKRVSLRLTEDSKPKSNDSRVSLSQASFSANVDIKISKELKESMKSLALLLEKLEKSICDFFEFCLRNSISPVLRGSITRAKLEKRDIKGVVSYTDDTGFYLCGVLQGDNVIVKDGSFFPWAEIANDQSYNLIKIEY
jgi:hypothetical protein